MAYIAWLGKNRKTFSSKRELIYFVKENPNLNMKVYEEDAFGNARELGTGEMLELISESKQGMRFPEENPEKNRQEDYAKMPGRHQKEHSGEAAGQRLFGQREPARSPREEYFEDRELLSNSINRIYGSSNPQQAAAAKQDAYSQLKPGASTRQGFLSHLILVLAILLGLIALYIVVPLIMQNFIGGITAPPVTP